MAGNRAPKQWSLTRQETIASFEAWRQNLQYRLSLDPNFAPFLKLMVDNLLKVNGGIRHHGENVAADEAISPTIDNLIVLTWLRLVDPSLPGLVKQRYGAELRSQTLASLKPENFPGTRFPSRRNPLCKRSQSTPHSPQQNSPQQSVPF